MDVLEEEVSFVMACVHFFSTGDHMKMPEINEFKALSKEDREALREELIKLGYRIRPLK